MNVTLYKGATAKTHKLKYHLTSYGRACFVKINHLKLRENSNIFFLCVCCFVYNFKALNSLI